MKTCPDDFLKPSHQIKITVHMDTYGSIAHEVWCCETSPVSFQIAKSSRLKVLKWQLCNHLIYIGICATCDPPLLGYNHFIGKHSSQTQNTPVKSARIQPTNQSTNQPTNSSTIPWSSELTNGGTLSKANALASLLTTLTVAARGSLRNRARSPKYCLRQCLTGNSCPKTENFLNKVSNIVGRIWPASWKDYKKKVIEKLRYEHSLEAILILGSVPSSIKPIVWCIPPDVWPKFGRYKVPRTLLQQWSVHKSLIIDCSCNHISYFIHLDFCETSSKGDFLYTLLLSTPRHPWFDYSTGTEYSKALAMVTIEM